MRDLQNNHFRLDDAQQVLGHVSDFGFFLGGSTGLSNHRGMANQKGRSALTGALKILKFVFDEFLRKKVGRLKGSRLALLSPYISCRLEVISSIKLNFCEILSNHMSSRNEAPVMQSQPVFVMLVFSSVSRLAHKFWRY